MRWSSLALFGLLAAPACAGTQLSSAYPEVAPAPIEAAPGADLATAPESAEPGAAAVDAAVDVVALRAAACIDVPELDPRCPADILAAAALSYLDKTVAEFDGTAMRVIEYDRDALVDEALADAGFRRLAQLADVAPSDGMLDHAEARDLESAVLELCELRVARR